MEVLFTQRELVSQQTQVLCVVGFEKVEHEAFPEELEVLDKALHGAIRQLYATGEFRGKVMETCWLYRPAGIQAERILLIGGGPESKFDGIALRRVAGAAVREIRARSLSEATFVVPATWKNSLGVRAVIEGAITGEYDPERYKTAEAEKRRRIEKLALYLDEVTEEIQAARDEAVIIAESQNYARELANEPPNVLTPQELAQRARQLAEESGLEWDILDEARMRQLGMGALLGVAQGSDQPPALIVLHYRPKQPPMGHTHLGLLGKAVTFDTGGISLKPSEKMDQMKFDMAGGAAVLGAMRAIASLRPPVAVTGIIPAVENMPGPRAQRPGDIVRTMSGKTVEVLNTDAEGRLILADAITYAQKLGCNRLIDAATLTGAIVVALGHVNTGLFTNNQSFADQVLRAAQAEGEKMWQMPLDDEYREELRSAFADIPNIGSRWGGAITAAMFLKEFVGDLPWVHLDIAGTAWLEESKPYMAKGATGVGVRTFVRLALDLGRNA